MPATDPDAIERRLAKLEALQAVTELRYRYCHGMDRRDADVFLGIWAPDGAEMILDPETASYSGIAEIRGALEGFWSALAETHHWTTNISTEVLDADHASGTCDVNAVFRAGETGWNLASATYDDEYERIDGTWYIRRRVAAVHYQLPIAVAAS